MITFETVLPMLYVTLVLQAPEDAYPVGVHVTTFTGKVYTFQVVQTNGLDY